MGWLFTAFKVLIFTLQEAHDEMVAEAKAQAQAQKQNPVANSRTNANK